MSLSMQSFCPTTARKLKTVHADYDAETHYFHLKTQTSQEEFGEYSSRRRNVGMSQFGIISRSTDYEGFVRSTDFEHHRQTTIPT